MNIYAVGNRIEIAGQILDSRGAYNATGLTAKARIVSTDYTTAAAGVDPKSITWDNAELGKWRVVFEPDDTEDIVPDEYCLQIDVYVDTDVPVSWYTAPFEIRPSNIPTA